MGTQPLMALTAGVASIGVSMRRAVVDAIVEVEGAKALAEPASAAMIASFMFDWMSVGVMVMMME